MGKPVVMKKALSVIAAIALALALVPVQALTSKAYADTQPGITYSVNGPSGADATVTARANYQDSNQVTLSASPTVVPYTAYPIQTQFEVNVYVMAPNNYTVTQVEYKEDGGNYQVLQLNGDCYQFSYDKNKAYDIRVTVTPEQSVNPPASSSGVKYSCKGYKGSETTASISNSKDAVLSTTATIDSQNSLVGGLSSGTVYVKANVPSGAKIVSATCMGPNSPSISKVDNRADLWQFEYSGSGEYTVEFMLDNANGGNEGGNNGGSGGNEGGGKPQNPVTSLSYLNDVSVIEVDAYKCKDPECSNVGVHYHTLNKSESANFAVGYTCEDMFSQPSGEGRVTGEMISSGSVRWDQTSRTLRATIAVNDQKMMDKPVGVLTSTMTVSINGKALEYTLKVTLIDSEDELSIRGVGTQDSPVLVAMGIGGKVNFEELFVGENANSIAMVNYHSANWRNDVSSDNDSVLRISQQSGPLSFEIGSTEGTACISLNHNGKTIKSYVKTVSMATYVAQKVNPQSVANALSVGSFNQALSFTNAVSVNPADSDNYVLSYAKNTLKSGVYFESEDESIVKTISVGSNEGSMPYLLATGMGTTTLQMKFKQSANAEPVSIGSPVEVTVVAKPASGEASRGISLSGVSSEISTGMLAAISDSTLNVSASSLSLTDAQAKDATGKDSKVLDVFDIHFEKNGVEWTFDSESDDGTVTVKVPLTDEMKKCDADSLMICYIGSDGVKQLIKPESVKDGYLYFKTSHFSSYAIVGTPSADSTGASSASEATTVGKTGDSIQLGLLIAFAFAAGIALFGLNIANNARRCARGSHRK